MASETEGAEAFGWRIYAEAVRRGLPRAEQVIVLGEGAPRIGGIAEEHFPSAVHIVDLYHAREHLERVSKIAYGQGTVAAKRPVKLPQPGLKRNFPFGLLSRQR